MREEHAMVFTGDWNGGERTFRVAPGQRLGLSSLERIDPQAGAVPLVHGDLDVPDHWDWSGR